MTGKPFPTDAAVIFEKANFRGKFQVLKKGKYLKKDILIGNDEVSSFYIPKGLSLKIFDKDGAVTGANRQFSKTRKKLRRWDDLASSLQVR